MRSSFLLLLILALVCATLCATNDTVPNSNCGGNCPSGRCTKCHCGTSRSQQDINAWCSKYTGWNQACCRCVVSRESAGNAHAENHNVGGSDDVGLWQINSMNWASCSGGQPPCDPNVNLKCAIKIWGYHKSFKLWSTCGACGCC
ncbi:hypothetical protein AKO1_013020 [Acrasis kona]|uniref:PlsX n=1 Tax=Acrasis kona TaxID=1008807 RepID=A0AAW2Z187_9EUKA